jgi:secreted trypsin-like serine protease
VYFYCTVVGGGDSGGPAICRNADGEAVLCGIAFFGLDEANCKNSPNENTCKPSLFVSVPYFNEWIQKKAGIQASQFDIKPSLKLLCQSFNGFFNIRIHY